MRWLFAAATASVGLLNAAVASAHSDCYATSRLRHTGLDRGVVPAVMIDGFALNRDSLEARMKFLHVPAVSIAFIHDRRVAWAKSFGSADGKGRCATTTTLFQAASMSKPVSTMAILHLSDAYLLDLDTGVNRYLRSWKVPQSRYSGPDGPTLRQIFTHTAGLTASGFEGYAAGQRVPTLNEVLDGSSPANSEAVRVDSPPGVEWRYSGGGYVVAQQLIEDVEHKPFADFMSETVLTPLQMLRSTYKQPLPSTMLSQAAIPFGDLGDPIEGGPHTHPEDAPAGLWTTPSDMALFALEMQESIAGRSRRIISHQAALAMTTPVRGVKEIGNFNWGLGLYLGNLGTHPYFAHAGGNRGYRSNLMAYNQGDGLVIMTNSDNGGQLIDDIMRTVAQDHGWEDFRPETRKTLFIPKERLSDYAGDYRLSSLKVVRVEVRDGHLALFMQGQPVRLLFAKSSEEWFSTDTTWSSVKFRVNMPGKAAELSCNVPGVQGMAERISGGEASKIDRELRQRIADQRPSPRSEDAMLKLVDGLQNDRPYTIPIPNNVRQKIEKRQADYKFVLGRKGPVKSVTFDRVTDNSLDLYRVTFNHGMVLIGLEIGQDGQVEDLTITAG